LMHYMFLDEPRTWNLVGEPAATSSTVLAYDFVHGFHVEKLMDLPHKRSALMMVSREKFFTLSPFVWDGEQKVRPSCRLYPGHASSFLSSIQVTKT
jgi:hypothetical protein